MEAGYEGARLIATHAVRVSEPLLAEHAEVADRVIERERLEPRLGQVVLHPVLPGGLHPLHGEFGEPHRRNGRTAILRTTEDAIAKDPGHFGPRPYFGV